MTFPLLLTLAALILAIGAEWLHLGRVRSVATLAFGPGGKASLAGRIAPPSVDRAVLARLADRSGIDARWCAAFEEDRGFFYGGDEIPGTAARMGLWLRAAKAMGREACTQALARANVAADRVTHVVTASCTGFAAPSVDAHLIESLGLMAHIDFVSGVSDERIVELYAEAELAVVPSLYEGFSLPAIEAMSTGICLVATDGGALPEVTGTDGDTVLQCPAGNASALAATIRRGLDSPELRARVGENGRQRVVSRWSWRHCAQLTVEQYREVLEMPHNQAKLQKRG
jgi:hypothetical protein